GGAPRWRLRRRHGWSRACGGGLLRRTGRSLHRPVTVVPSVYSHKHVIRRCCPVGSERNSFSNRARRHLVERKGIPLEGGRAVARVVALGDAHLGRQYYSRTTPDGANQRERDFEQSFEAAVDLTLSLEPDVVLWLGDVFDHPRPGYRASRVGQRAIGNV